MTSHDEYVRGNEHKLSWGRYFWSEMSSSWVDGITVGLVKAKHPFSCKIPEAVPPHGLGLSQNFGPLLSISGVRNWAKCFDPWMGL